LELLNRRLPKIVSLRRLTIKDRAWRPIGYGLKYRKLASNLSCGARLIMLATFPLKDSGSRTIENLRSDVLVKAALAIATNYKLRQQPIWRLLAADKAPAFIGLLHTHLLEADKSLPASVLYERIGRDIEILRTRGEDLPQTPQSYVAEWLSQGWLTRRFPAGAAEEEFELTADAAAALRFIAGLERPRTVATESRLATVMQQLSRLAEETDTNPRTRIAALIAERERIDREIGDVEQGRLKTLPDERALERVQEIITLAEELAGE
jgi:uncharacterized protein DUF3375